VNPADGATRIVAVRHGETAWNAEARMQGQLDIALNERGQWQAKRLARALVDERIDAFYASDLKRAIDTALAVTSLTGHQVKRDAGLRERAFGSFESHTYADIELKWPQQAALWKRRDIDFAPEGGESLRTFYERCIATVSRLAVQHRGQTIAVVAHGGVMDCLYRAATRISLDATRTWQLGNASINRLLHTEEGFTLVGWSDMQHLDESSLDEAADGASG